VRTALLALLLLAVLVPARARADATYPERPGDREFVADEANLLSQEDRQQIVGICDRLLTERKIPILVVTISSMADFGASGWSIERYARSLFDAWGIGFQDWNRGMLLLVSVGDRKARIELGFDWAGTRNRESQQVMDTLVIPAFKKGEFSRGILDGVRGLDAIARDLELPKRPTPLWVWLMWAGFVGLGVFTAVSLARRGASGWAWLLWAGVFTVLFLVLKGLAKGAASGGGGGGWSGGSFGGGGGGGGGASGSW
jgi:uncharacterized protein